jgi:phosphatidylinositol alpha-1,6-mannosyltransferase
VVTGSALNPQYRSELEALSRGCGVPVRFVGEVDRVTLRALYASAELFCMPGERDPKSVEGFGLAYLEAAAQRVPAIGSFLGGVPEVVQDGQTGVLLPPGRPALVAETLERLLTDPARARAMGRQARFWAEKFSWTRCAAMTYQSAS